MGLGGCACDCYGLTVQYSTAWVFGNDRTPPSRRNKTMTYEYLVHTPHEGPCDVFGWRTHKLYLALLGNDSNAIYDAVRRMIPVQLDEPLYHGLHFVGPTPLVFAAWQDNTYGIDALVEHGAKVDQKDAFGWSPLYMAVDKENMNAALALIGHGADVNAYHEEFGKSVLDVAMEQNQQSMV